jgi:hypothetical protein
MRTTELARTEGEEAMVGSSLSPATHELGGVTLSTARRRGPGRRGSTPNEGPGTTRIGARSWARSRSATSRATGTKRRPGTAREEATGTPTVCKGPLPWMIVIGSSSMIVTALCWSSST